MPVAWQVAVRSARAHWAELQHRNGYYLMLNSAVGAAAGTAFWLVLVRGYAFDAHDVGLSVALISLATALALVAKGGLDAALVRYLPGLPEREGRALLRLAVAIAFVAACVLAALTALVPRLIGAPATTLALVLVGLLAGLLAATWLQDAYFLAAGEARLAFYRNLVLHGARLLAPVPVLLLGLAYPIPLAWGAALAASALAAWVLIRRLPTPSQPRQAPEPRALRKGFVRSAMHNAPAGAVEFVPGLLLVPLVLHLEGPEAAAWFGIAWAGASALFLVSAAIARSAFAEMSRRGDHAACVRRAARQMVLVLAPATLLAVLTAPLLLGLFGPGYASHGLGVFLLLAVSVILVAPVHLYLALLRSRDARTMLVVMPFAVLAVLVLAAPFAMERWGLAGAAVAWGAAHAPWALVAVATLRRETTRPARGPQPLPTQTLPAPATLPVPATSRAPDVAEEVAHGTGPAAAAHRGGPHL